MKRQWTAQGTRKQTEKSDGDSKVKFMKRI